jgi:broad specificity phosphatase PhoE
VTRLILVRHGRAAAGFGADLDPGLDDVGHAQAKAAADALTAFGPLPILTSPLRRARETAGPLEQQWDVVAKVEPAVGEIPSPSDDLTTRARWLESVLARRWPEVDRSLRTWRSGVVDFLTDLSDDTVVVTHFVVINVAVGSATADDRIVCCRPANASRTELTVEDGQLHLIAAAAEDDTEIL